MTTLTYQTTQAQVDSLLQQLGAGGSTITVKAPDDDEISGKGITVEAKFDPATGTLTVDIEHKPFMIPVSMIDGGIKKALGVS